ncbi:MAG: sugar ABC transporter permease [Spirochaetaceae bacterium]|jgi:multiple sugar transport system permease protein|nr:sugar ABC transporter permease [Spirochaetaceae bacterium]
MKNTERRNALQAVGFLLPSLIGFAGLSILPMIISLVISTTSWDGLSELALFSAAFADGAAFADTYFTGLSNYAAIFTGAELYQVLGNTLRFVLLYLPFMLLASFGVATILNKEIPGGTFFRVLYYIPVITSWVAGALIWKWVLSPEYGVVNNVLAIFGIAGPGWLQSPKWAMPGIVLASVWKDMGFFGLMLFAGLRGINKEYYEAADLDGAGKGRQLLHITLPLLSPVFFFVITISMITAFQVFPQVMIMTPDGGPGGSTMVMVERVYRYAFRYYEMGYASALSWVLFIIILSLTLVQTRLQDKWVVYDA